MITFPIDRTPFHTQKYTSTQATDKLMASGTLRGPVSSIPLETFRTSFLINVKKKITLFIQWEFEREFYWKKNWWSVIERWNEEMILTLAGQSQRLSHVWTWKMARLVKYA